MWCDYHSKLSVISPGLLTPNQSVFNLTGGVIWRYKCNSQVLYSSLARDVPSSWCLLGVGLHRRISYTGEYHAWENMTVYISNILFHYNYTMDVLKSNWSVLIWINAKNCTESFLRSNPLINLWTRTCHKFQWQLAVFCGQSCSIQDESVVNIFTGFKGR